MCHTRQACHNYAQRCTLYSNKKICSWPAVSEANVSKTGVLSESIADLASCLFYLVINVDALRQRTLSDLVELLLLFAYTQIRAVGASATGLEKVRVAIVHPVHTAGVAEGAWASRARSPTCGGLVVAVRALLAVVALKVPAVVLVGLGS